MSNELEPQTDIIDVRDSTVLKALTHPARKRIINVLGVHGPATVGQLAERLDLAVGSVSHHLSVLADAKIVEQAPELARDGRERWWRRATKGFRWGADQFDDPSARLVAEAAEASLLDDQHAAALRWLHQRDDDDAMAQASFASQAWLWLSAPELAQLQVELQELLDRYRGRDHDGREPILFIARGFPSEP